MTEKCILDPQRDCLGLAEAKLLEKRISDLESWQVKSSEFHEKFYNYQREQIDRDARLDEQIKTMSGNILKLVSWQEEQVQKPVKHWDSAVDKVISGVIGALIGVVGAAIILVITQNGGL